MPLKPGELVQVKSEAEDWFGWAIVHSVRAHEIRLRWIVCNNLRHYYKHIDGCDAFVPANWCTKIEVEDAI